MRDHISKHRQKAIETDVAFLEKAIKQAPVGDPSDKEMADIYATVRARRKTYK